MASSQREPSLSFDIDTNRLFRIGNKQYVALGEFESTVPSLRGHQRLLTVLPTDPNEDWTKDTLAGALADLEVGDDVSCALFRDWLLFSGTSPGAIKLSHEVLAFLEKKKIQHTLREIGVPTHGRSYETRGFAAQPLPPGPYLRDGNKIRPIWRLYEDRNVTLIDSLAPSRIDRSDAVSSGHLRSNLCTPYSSLHILSDEHTIRLAAVPPKTPTRSDDERQSRIRGKRIVVKDIFDIAGLRKTACNRAYYDVETTATQTAGMIQRLIDAGACIVGKARLSSMVSREEPSESFDYEVPFNPRGDGYQSPAGSSSGSAAAVAAYDWLDFGIGTDSTGSARRPAMANGVFSIRISCGVLPVDGMVPCFPLFDAPAVFTRDLRDLDGFVREWCGPDLHSSIQAPTSILVPTDYYPVSNRMQQDIIDEFVRDLSACLHAEIRNVCLRDKWHDNPPLEAVGQSLALYLQDVGQNSFFYDFYHSTDEFRSKYQQKHSRWPAVNRVTKWRWTIGRDISKAQRDEAVRRLAVYKSWLLEQILVDGNPIVVLPVMDAVTAYRDTPACDVTPATQEAWDQLWMSPILGAPEVTLPIGHIAYHSRVSEVEEMLPVAVSLLGLSGTDVSLINNAKTVLAKSGRHLRVATGREVVSEEWEMIERTQSL